MVDYASNYMSGLQPNALTNAMAQVQQMNTETKRQDDYAAAGQEWAAKGPEAAQDSLKNAGQLDEAMKIKQHVEAMNADQRKVVSDIADKFARAAMLADTPADWARFLSSAKRSGLDTTQYEGMPFNDAKVHALAHSDLTVQFINQKNLQEQRAIQQQQFAQTQAQNLAKENVPYASDAGVVPYNKMSNTFGEPTAIPPGVDMNAPIKGAQGGKVSSSKEERIIAQIKADNPGMTDTDAIEHYRDLTAKNIAGTQLTVKKDDQGNVVRDAEGRLIKEQTAQAGSIPWIRQQTLKLKEKGMDLDYIEQAKNTAARAAEQGKWDAKTIDARAAIAAPVIDHAVMMGELLKKPNASDAVGWIHSNQQYQNMLSQIVSDKYYDGNTPYDRSVGAEKMAILQKNLDDIERDPSAPNIARRLAQLTVGIGMEVDRLFTTGQGQVAARTREEIRPLVTNIITAPTPAQALSALNNLQDMMVKIMVTPSSRDISKSPAIQSGRAESLKRLESVATESMRPKSVPPEPVSQQPHAVGNAVAVEQFSSLPDDTIVKDGRGKRYRIMGGRATPMQ
jgi:hypothetical protein